MNWWPFRRRNTEPVIKPLSAEHYRFVGHDEAMEVRARQRRELAEKIRRDARLIETQDDKRAKLTRVK